MFHSATVLDWASRSKKEELLWAAFRFSLSITFWIGNFELGSQALGQESWSEIKVLCRNRCLCSLSEIYIQWFDCSHLESASWFGFGTAARLKSLSGRDITPPARYQKLCPAHSWTRNGGLLLWGFRPLLEVLAKHFGPGGPVLAADLRVVKWAVTG